jgi:hypothetical protein
MLAPSRPSLSITLGDGWWKGFAGPTEIKASVGPTLSRNLSRVELALP